MDLKSNLAKYLLSLDEGDQLQSTRHLAELFDVSLGSISSTMNHLEKIGAVKIDRRGHLGSFLEKKSIKTIWKTIENNPIVIALTLPYFKKCEGMATAIYYLLNNAGIETYLVFIRGSINRVNALRNCHCNAIVISELAADELCDSREEIILKLPPLSFVDEHRVFFLNKKQDDGEPLTVGIDPESLDIKYTSELEFSDSEVDFKKMTFTQIDLHLEDSPVDAAITTSDFLDRLTNKGLESRPLSPKVQKIVGDRLTSAAIVARSKDVLTKTILQEILDAGKILDIQNKVEKGEMVPRY